ncbi:type 1 glutamine amidotransferase domain-containing protein [Dermacoccaceae bacterium W4C1]
MAKSILMVVTNVSHYADPGHPTGLWLSELTHAWAAFEAQGWSMTLVSPNGGPTPLEPRSLKFPNIDRTGRAWLASPARMALLEQTAAPQEVRAEDFDAIYFTGGHATMYDFPDSEGLQRLTREIYEAGGVVAAVCHGYCGLLNTRLSDGSLLVAGRELTGFAWREEVLGRVDRLVPYNAERAMRARGARYRKARLPFVSHTVVDGRLVTGQNPGSAKACAEQVIRVLS